MHQSPEPPIVAISRHCKASYKVAMLARNWLAGSDGIMLSKRAIRGSQGEGAMVSVSSNVHPTEDSDSQESPSGIPSGGSCAGSPECMAQEEPAVLPPSVTLSVDACFSGQTVLITGDVSSETCFPAPCDCPLWFLYILTQLEHHQACSAMRDFPKKRTSLVGSYTIVEICVQVSQASWAVLCWSSFFAYALQ